MNGSSASPVLIDQGPQFLGDDIGDNTSSTTSIAVGGTISSSIQHGGDLDYFRVNLVAGQSYTFSVVGMPDAYVELRDSTGALVADNDDGGISLNAFLMTRAPTTGQYFVVARGYDASSTGAYTLSVNAIATGNTSPTQFTPNGLPTFSWEEAAIQITRSGASWSTAFNTPTVVTYAYRSTAPGTMPDDTGGFSRFSAAQIAATELALAAWSAVANITFQRVDNGQGYADNAAMLFANYSTGAAGAAAFAYLPSDGNRDIANVQGDVWINNTFIYNVSPVIGQYGPQVLLHEIGHALGLSHPAAYNAAEGVEITYGANATYYQDSRMFTSMSYFGSSNTGGTLGAYASLPQMHDIAAIQRLYGVNTTTRTGDTVYGFNSNTGVAAYTVGFGQAAVFAIWDGGGNDTLDLSGFSTNSVIDLRQESFSSAGPTPEGPTGVFNISIARGAVIENAIGGSGNDAIIGNSSNNVLTGNAGNDQLIGLGGIDTAFYAIASTSASWHRNVDGTWTVTAGSEGVDVLNGVERLDFTNRDVFLAPAPTNFNADGVSDLMWRNGNTNAVSLWLISGTQQISDGGGFTGAAGWTPRTVADFNGDGIGDIVWQTSGATSIWLLDSNRQPINGGTWYMPAEWNISKAGDFNGDGIMDLLLRNANTGALSIWRFDQNLQISNGGGWNVGTEWTVAQTGDFNSDGISDLLWRSTNGSTQLWLFNSAGQPTNAGGWYVPTSWTAQETGDFNRDGISDILWRNSNGELSLWLMGTDQQPTNGGGWFVPTSWNIADVGDYNGDGVSDIMWRGSSGELSLWLFDQNQNITNGGSWYVPPEWGTI